MQTSDIDYASDKYESPEAAPMSVIVSACQAYHMAFIVWYTLSMKLS